MLVHGTTYLLSALGVLGTAAMIWVGGGIVLHGLETYGLGWPAHAIHDAATFAARLLPAAGTVVGWLVEAAGAGLFGIVVGLAAIPAMTYCVSPLWRLARSRLRPAKP
jgi:predicted DNA repair protein MutK